MNLRLKIAQSLPTDSVSLRALLSMASIEESQAIPTACVTFGHNPRLLLNPTFVQRHANTSAKLQTLISHELLHVALGHTRRFKTCGRLDNLVFDCLINATLAKAEPTPERTALFRDFYDEDKFPECFLRPPDVWHPSMRVRLPKALKWSRAEGLFFVKDVYRRLWSDVGATDSEIRAAIVQGASSLNQPVDVALSQVPLLGGHDESDEVVCTTSEVLGNLVAEEITGKQIKRGISPCDVLSACHESNVAATNHQYSKNRLRGLFACLAHGVGSARLRTKHGMGTGNVSPIPHKDRRAIVQRLLGTPTLLYNAPSHDCPLHSSERIHVYLDVSGSMDGVISALYGAMQDVSGFIHREVHLFSTKVVSISLSQLKAGLRATTYGTNFDCVAEHIKKHRIKRALIVTDGFVGELSEDARQTLKEIRFAVGLAGHDSTSLTLKDLALRCERLD
jgi:hypothetical protein